MKVLVTGSTGMVGSRFIELSTKYDFVTPSYPEFDLTKKESIDKVIKENNPDVIVHLAAYTDVSKAEEQRNDKNGDCWKVNVEGTKNLISSIDASKVHFIHISTDYVFSGSKDNPGPYSEDSMPEKNSDKVTWYGFTKSEAEREVNSTLGDSKTILRIIYPVRAKYDQKLDYLRKPLSLFDQGKLYPMFNDQQVSITFIDELSLVLEKIIDSKIYGVFHCSSIDTGTPFDLVSYLLKKVRNVDNVVKPSSLDEFIKNTGNSEVRYPKYGGLDPQKTSKDLGIKLSSWKEIIDKLANQGIGN
jgi:dTDP-4-dehydrorhamnose reductase